MNSMNSTDYELVQQYGAHDCFQLLHTFYPKILENAQNSVLLEV